MRGSTRRSSLISIRNDLLSKVYTLLLLLLFFSFLVFYHTILNNVQGRGEDDITFDHARGLLHLGVQ